MSSRLWIWKCTHCTGAHTLRTYNLGVYSVRLYRLGLTILDLEAHSLHWGLHMGAYKLGAYMLGAYGLESPILRL